MVVIGILVLKFAFNSLMLLIFIKTYRNTIFENEVLSK